MSAFRSAPPKAGTLIESLRGMGYTTATALADIIDNSIAAQAKQVEVRFEWRAGESRVSVWDDGCGMTDAELDVAMRLGELGPSHQRSSSDLGRFGLGLKTASFSQCRRLTVASIRYGQLSCLHWDLDLLASSTSGEWMLFEGAPASSQDLIEELLARGQGTLVLWEVLDRIVTPAFTSQNYLDLIDRVEQHLAMVFHRFISSPRAALKISVNGRKVEGWDPFLEDHPATWQSPTARVGAADSAVEAQCFVLPHQDRLDEETYKAAAGPDGWTAQQGFYVYRNRRLLVAGSWLGLGQGRLWSKEEAHRLARIRLDIPNNVDAAWKIDIRKSTAGPPVEVRELLVRLADDTRQRARRVFAQRGKATTSRGTPVVQAWMTDRTRTGVRYRIDQNHPAVRMVLEGAKEQRSAVLAMLRVIEETVPVQRIWLDTAETKETPQTGFASAPVDEIEGVLRALYRGFTQRKGMSSQEAREQLLVTEPFNQYPELVMALPDEVAGRGNEA